MFSTNPVEIIQSGLSFHDESFYYHSIDRNGFFSILQSSQSSNTASKLQKSYSLELFPQVIMQIDRSFDTYISQSEFFKPNRREVNLLRMSVLYVDIDVYRLLAVSRG